MSIKKLLTSVGGILLFRGRRGNFVVVAVQDGRPNRPLKIECRPVPKGVEYMPGCDYDRVDGKVERVLCYVET